ncbi:uncharacterized protein G2W53_035217 [Senna tora]|uniref:Uncharacterized protein n=1 Tax=Senna tora TaxID=362788 RepID=A0A834W910_9FABA|nr:uncharacterized protein G2W53_035217 [Senna tora]
MFYLVVVILVAKLSEESLRGLIDICPIVILQGVTDRTLVYDPGSEDFAAVNGVQGSLPPQVEDGVTSLLERVMNVRSKALSHQGVATILSLFLENPFLFSYGVANYPLSLSLLS